MRIAYLTQSYPPMISGAAMFASQLANAMAERGHQVLVIAASDRDQPYLVQNGNLTVLRLRSHHNPLRVGQRFLLYPRRATLKALREFQPDLIHTHEPLQMGNLGIEYAREAHIPITLTNHQLPWFAASYLPDKFGIRDLVENILWMYARWMLPSVHIHYCAHSNDLDFDHEEDKHQVADDQLWNGSGFISPAS